MRSKDGPMIYICCICKIAMESRCFSTVQLKRKRFDCKKCKSCVYRLNKEHSTENSFITKFESDKYNQPEQYKQVLKLIKQTSGCEKQIACFCSKQMRRYCALRRDNMQHLEMLKLYYKSQQLHVKACSIYVRWICNQYSITNVSNDLIKIISDYFYDFYDNFPFEDEFKPDIMFRYPRFQNPWEAPCTCGYAESAAICGVCVPMEIYQGKTLKWIPDKNKMFFACPIDYNIKLPFYHKLLSRPFILRFKALITIHWYIYAIESDKIVADTLSPETLMGGDEGLYKQCPKFGDKAMVCYARPPQAFDETKMDGTNYTYECEEDDIITLIFDFDYGCLTVFCNQTFLVQHCIHKYCVYKVFVRIFERWQREYLQIVD